MKIDSRKINLFRKFRQMSIKTKIRIQRTTSYLAIFNSGMIFFLVLSKLQEYGLNIHITKWFFPLYVVTVLLLIFIGWIDEKIGFFHEELKQKSSRNPYMVQIETLSAKIEILEKKIDKLSSKKK